MASENDPKDPPADLFPFDEMSTGETSSLIRRANQLTGKPDQPLSLKERERAEAPPLKPMTGAQLAFRPSAPPRQPGQTGSFAPLQPNAKPATGTQPAYKPSAPSSGSATGNFKPLNAAGGTQSNPAFKPLNTPPRGTTGTNPAFKPLASSGGTQSNPAFKPLGASTTGTNPAFKPGSGSQPAHKPTTGSPARPPPQPQEPSESDEAPVFDVERLQAQIRHLGITDSALGRAAQGNKVKPQKATSSAAEDTFVKSKMKQAEAKVPDFSLDDDLG
ncbi:MAG: hypothetical protein JNM17_23845 [Archangium sp.]|nr:hypothetical protein [Archangium sp.]